MSRIPILMYHQVTPDPDPRFREYSVTVRAFEAQMAWLEDAGFTTVGIDRLAGILARRKTGPRRPVVITFDDGFAECAERAIPVLQKHGFTAVFYLVAGLIGGSSRWLLDDLGVEFPLLDWDTARDLASEGFEIGSHCLHHVPLTEAGPEIVRRELFESRRLLEERLGREVRHLAYPYGEASAIAVAAAAAAGYSTACTSRPGIASGRTNRMLLPRVYVGEDSRSGFRFRLATARTPREWLRNARKSLHGLALGRSSERIVHKPSQMEDVAPPGDRHETG